MKIFWVIIFYGFVTVESIFLPTDSRFGKDAYIRIESLPDNRRVGNKIKLSTTQTPRRNILSECDPGGGGETGSDSVWQWGQHCWLQSWEEDLPPAGAPDVWGGEVGGDRSDAAQCCVLGAECWCGLVWKILQETHQESVERCGARRVNIRRVQTTGASWHKLGRKR